MNPENPLVTLGPIAWMVGYSVVHSLGALPDPNEPMFATVMGGIGAVVGAILHLARHRSAQGIQLTSFLFGISATGIGYAVYAGFVVAAGFQ
jgi:hypothetical protein